MTQLKKASEILEDQMHNEFQALLKGKALPEGTIRDWKGQKYKKQGGTWQKVRGEKKTKSTKQMLIDSIIENDKKVIGPAFNAKAAQKDLQRLDREALVEIAREVGRGESVPVLTDRGKASRLKESSVSKGKGGERAPEGYLKNIDDLGAAIRDIQRGGDAEKYLKDRNDKGAFMRAVDSKSKGGKKKALPKLESAVNAIMDSAELVPDVSKLEAAKTMIANIDASGIDPEKYMTEKGDVGDKDVQRFVADHPDFDFGDEHNFSDSYPDMMADLLGEEDEEDEDW